MWLRTPNGYFIEPVGGVDLVGAHHCDSVSSAEFSAGWMMREAAIPYELIDIMILNQVSYLHGW